MTLAAFLTVAMMHLMAAISPGPAVLMSARIGLTEGPRAGAFIALGIGVGGVVWASAALFGLAVVFQAAPALLWALRLGGAAYLVWMAWGLWRDADLQIADTAAATPRNAFAAFRLGLWTQLSNPKPAILFSAIFLGTVPKGTAGWVYVALLLVVFANETLWNCAVARIFSFNRARHTYMGLKSVIDRALGGMLALLGLKVAAF